MTLDELKIKLDEANYIYDDTLATILCVALQLGRPLLIEGAAGVGKTEIAKVMAAALGRDLVRLQCYEGLDESKALYEWNYQKQLLAIQVGKGETDKDALTKSLFSDEYMLARPLLQSIRSEKPVVLLIDEIDKADEEFEAFLLELLSEMQVSIPEVGTIKASSVPFVVLTSNRARPLSEALRRRCAYIYITYPDIEKELRILRAKVPHVDEQLAVQVAMAVKRLRNCEAILKKPSIAESLDWAAALEALSIRELTPEEIRKTMGFVLKNSEDFDTADELFSDGLLEDPEEGECSCAGHEDGKCPHGHEHHHAHDHEHGHTHGHGQNAGYTPLNVSRVAPMD
ncbi:MAG: MoxR family ATPase [Lachnospiraceae bacterium]|nr:MoxR family ATPase [Lachnospiraceae bacterium]